MLQFVQLSSFTNTAAFQVHLSCETPPVISNANFFQPLSCWTPDGTALSEHLKAVSEYVARCTIWVGPPAAPSPDAAKSSPGSFLDNISRMQEVAASVVPKSQTADIYVVSELESMILRWGLHLRSSLR
jgi:hypothetical protein